MNQSAGGENELITFFFKEKYEGGIKSSFGSLSTSFTSLCETIAHELAHALQFSQQKKSSCESDLGTKR